MERSNNENDSSHGQERLAKGPEEATPRQHLVYYKLLWVAYWHAGGLYGLYLCCTSAKWATILLNYFMYLSAGCGVTAGAERLWSRRSYTATTPLQVLLMMLQTMAWYGPVIQWVRNMRLHQYYRDTEADPFNSKRGFLYSRFGWIMMSRHTEVIERGNNVDLSDVNENPVLQFQKEYYLLLSSVLVFLLPTFISAYFWQETFNTAYHVCLFRVMVGMYTTFGRSSETGIKPTGKSALGSYEYHIFERYFPFQYSTSELFQSHSSTHFIKFFAYIGWAYINGRSKNDIGTKQSKINWSWHDDETEESVIGHY